jgi:hypothetical protein
MGTVHCVRKPPYVPRKTIQEYVENVNGIIVALTITHVENGENVEARVMSYDAIVVTKDDNVDANVVSYDSIVVTKW